MSLDFQLAESKTNGGPSRDAFRKHALQGDNPLPRHVRFGPFQLDMQRQDLLKHGVRVRMPAKVCQVLITLLERPGEVVTREELRARLWPSDTHVNFDANVNTTVNKLRQILGDSNEQSNYVQTIPRRGYSLVCAVEFVRPSETASPNAPVTAASAADAEFAAENAGDSANAVTPISGGSVLFAPHRSQIWITAGVIALVLSAILLGAAIE